MPQLAGRKRTDSAAKIIKAPAQVIYRAFLDPNAVAVWRPPRGMTARIEKFEPRQGGGYRMAFVYTELSPEVRGKTSAHADVFDGQFIELVPDHRIVERVEFESDDPAFSGAMTITTTFTPVPAGTEVRVTCENVPPGISPEQHERGMASTLENLAAFTE
jgi:uncharacterized protein YndB with AHSA1/START domain